MIRREEKSYKRRLYVVVYNTLAWKMIVEALGKTETDFEPVRTLIGTRAGLEVTKAEIQQIVAAADDKHFTFEIYQKLWSGDYARFTESLREEPVERTTTDPKARDAVQDAKRKKREITSPLRRDMTSVRPRRHL